MASPQDKKRRRKDPQAEDTSSSAHVSFIAIVDFAVNPRWVYMSESVSELLGYDPSELTGTSTMDLVHPDEQEPIRKLHYDTIKADKAACIVYFRIRHKDILKGYVLCGVSRTIVHDRVVGSVFYATPAKALHSNATASEVNIVSDAAVHSGLCFRRWNDPSPTMAPLSLPSSHPPPPSPLLATSPPSTRTGTPSIDPSTSPLLTPTPTSLHPYALLPVQSPRTALILNRFSLSCPIEFISNSLLIPNTNAPFSPGQVTAHSAIGKSIFHFVAKKDEESLRGWIATVKGWGRESEQGQGQSGCGGCKGRCPPGDGGFAFCRFRLCPKGRREEGTINATSESKIPAGGRAKKALSKGKKAREKAAPIPTSSSGGTLAARKKKSKAALSAPTSSTPSSPAVSTISTLAQSPLLARADTPTPDNASKADSLEAPATPIKRSNIYQLIDPVEPEPEPQVQEQKKANELSPKSNVNLQLVEEAASHLRLSSDDSTTGSGSGAEDTDTLMDVDDIEVGGVGTSNGNGAPVVAPAPAGCDYDAEDFDVDAILSAHSDGMVIILRRAEAPTNKHMHTHTA